MKYILYLFFAASLMACGGGKMTTVGPKASTSKQEVVVEGSGDKDPTPTDGILVGLELTDAFKAEFSDIKLELDIGTVIGKTGDLDSNQGGDLTIHKTYKSGQKGYSFFTSGGTTKDDVDENYWHYNSDNKLVWRGVFEGPRGAMVVVVDGIYKSGDGTEAYDYMSGSVWFRKWPVVEDTGINSDKCWYKNGRLDCKNPSGPLVRCWKVSLGPYDCRFNISDNSKTVSAVGNKYTDQAYVKVGTFIELSKKKTFKEEY